MKKQRVMKELRIQPTKKSTRSVGVIKAQVVCGQSEFAISFISDGDQGGVWTGIG
jgi:hypothetical protein